MTVLKPLKEYNLHQLANIRLYGDPEGKQRALPLSVRDGYRDVVNAYVSTLPERERNQFGDLVTKALDSVPEAEAVSPGYDTSLTRRLMALD